MPKISPLIMPIICDDNGNMYEAAAIMYVSLVQYRDELAKRLGVSNLHPFLKRPFTWPQKSALAIFARNVAIPNLHTSEFEKVRVISKARLDYMFEAFNSRTKHVRKQAEREMAATLVKILEDTMKPLDAYAFNHETY